MSVETAEAPTPEVMATFRDAERVLARSLPGYQSRTGQQMLAGAIEAVMAKEDTEQSAAAAGGNLGDERYPNHLLGQAPTGSGKSLAYLIPLIISGQKVAVSVTTKALQNQLVRKDVPFLENNLGIDFTWAMLQGRSNYLCFNNIATLTDTSDLTTLAAIRSLAIEDPEFSGLREDIPFDVPDMEWAQMRAEAESCRDCGCSRETEGEEGCFAVKARRKAAKAQLIIVNHALTCTDLKLKSIGIEGMMADRSLIVFDEAHELEEVASNTLGFEIRQGTFTTLVNDVRTFALTMGNEDDTDGIEGYCGQVLAAAEDLYDAFGRIEEIEKGRETIFRLEEKALLRFGGQFLQVIDTVVALQNFWEKINFRFENGKERNRWAKITTRLVNTLARTRQIVTDRQIDLVRWVEVTQNRRDEKVLIIKATPVSVAEFMNTFLWSQMPTISVSATMTVGNSFRFIAGNLGIKTGKTINVPSPFDFAKQELLYVPRKMPLPRGAELLAFESDSVEEIIRLVKISEGRAMVLFTSRKRMQQAAEEIRDRQQADQRRVDMGMTLTDEDRVGFPYRLLVQGEMQNGELQQAFREDIHSVLFGLKSFMTGVDFQGPTLSMLVIPQLTFPNPGDPVHAAKMERVEAEGGNAFSDYMMPVMSLVLQQAIGRLIRSVDDTGVVAVLDRRLADMGYGKKIQKDLRLMSPSRELEDVVGFYASH
jgi:ATP-dependent DNA helicase DinG